MGVTVWWNDFLESLGLAPPPSRDPVPETCVFCKKIADEDDRRQRNGGVGSGDFIYMDDELVVFKDWKPAAEVHYLVCTRCHLTSARALKPSSDAALARRMLELGKEVVARDAPAASTGTRFGFHIPPFNSVDHVHMHAFALPFKSEWKERKYSLHPLARFAFMPAEELVARLEAEAEGSER